MNKQKKIKTKNSKKVQKSKKTNKSFSIANFCEVDGIEFKKYYEYLNNPDIFQMCISMIPHLMSDKIQTSLFSKIELNKEVVVDKMKKVDTIISFYEMNDDIRYSEIGQFFGFYKRIKDKMKITNSSPSKKLLLFFNELILYPKVLSVLKECFYIFSDRRSCVYYLTPGIDFNNTTKKAEVKRVVKHFKGNMSMLTQIISKTYQFNDNPWGSKYYSSAYATFDTFQILKKYFNDPLKECDLNVTTHLRKFDSNKKMVDYLCKMYHEYKLGPSKYDDQISPNHIQNTTHFLIALKKLGYDLWFIIPLMMDGLYGSYEIKNIIFPIYHCDKYIQLQSNNFKIGIMAFLLVRDGFITNTQTFYAPLS